MQLSDIPLHTPDVVGRLLGEEAVLVQPQQGVVRVLNAVGARLWELADGGRTVGELADIIAAEYDVDKERASADALAFCEDLARRGMLRLAG
jgi:hypothetical protein